MAEDFKGVWIPKEIWQNNNLSLLDKVILAKISSLDNTAKGCYASNKHISEFCHCGERSVSRSLDKIQTLGLIQVNISKFNSRTIKVISMDSQIGEGDSQIGEGDSQIGDKVIKYSNTDSNKVEGGDESPTSQATKFTAHDFQLLWNEWLDKNCLPNKRIVTMKAPRIKKFNARQKTYEQDGANTKEFWEQILKVLLIAKNGWYVGNAPIKEGYSTPWTADFKWLFKNDDAIAELMEVGR